MGLLALAPQKQLIGNAVQLTHELVTMALRYLVLVQDVFIQYSPREHLLVLIDLLCKNLNCRVDGGNTCAESRELGLFSGSRAGTLLCCGAPLNLVSSKGEFLR